MTRERREEIVEMAKPILLPAILALLVAGSFISGGYNIDGWSLQRSIVVAGLIVGLVLSLRDRDEHQ